jgi:hypothetical protein
VRVAVAQSAGEPGPAAEVEVVAGLEQQLSDLVQRVGLAPAMSGGGLLVRRRTSSIAALARRMMWKWSTTSVAWPRCTPTALA